MPQVLLELMRTSVCQGLKAFVCLLFVFSSTSPYFQLLSLMQTIARAKPGEASSWQIDWLVLPAAGQPACPQERLVFFAVNTRKNTQSEDNRQRVHSSVSILTEQMRRQRDQCTITPDSFSNASLVTLLTSLSLQTTYDSVRSRDWTLVAHYGFCR